MHYTEIQSESFSDNVDVDCSWSFQRNGPLDFNEYWLREVPNNFFLSHSLNSPRGKGPLKNSSDVINAAKKIAEAGSRMDKLARAVADQVAFCNCVRHYHFFFYSYTFSQSETVSGCVIGAGGGANFELE